MDVIQCLFLIFITACLLFLVGHSFIDSYFKRKEEMMNKLIQTGRGELNA